MIGSNYLMIAQGGLEKLGVPDWSLMGFWCIGIAWLGYVALQYGVLRNKGATMFGIVLLLAAGFLATWHQVHDTESFVLIAFMALASAGAIGFVTIREPVYAALGFATAVLSSCGILFMQYAYFVSAATMIVYAGATIIIFLFVLMFAHQGHLQTYDLKLNNPIVSAIVVTVLMGTIYYSILNTPLVAASTDAITTRANSSEVALEQPGSTAQLGRTLYTDYLFSVEIAGTLLLVATIGAISVAARSSEADA